MPSLKATDGTEQSLPAFQSHKQVQACVIAALDYNAETGAWLLTPAEPYLKPFHVTAAFAKRSPRVGGYFVLYRDGYQSWSPAREFEDGYLPVDALQQRKQELMGQLAEVQRAIEAHSQGALA